MDPKEIIGSVVPNPFSPKSSLSDVAKKGEILAEGFGLASILKQIFSLCIFAVLLVQFFTFPIEIISVLAVVEILSMILVGAVRIRKIRLVSRIRAEGDAGDYRNILVARESSLALMAFCGFLVSLIGAFIVLSVFPDEVKTFFIANSPFPAGILRYLVWAIVGFKFIAFALAWLKSSIVKGMKQSTDFAEVNRSYSVVLSKFSLFKIIPFAFVFVGGLAWAGFPYYIPLIFGAFLVFFISLSVIGLKRLQKVDLANTVKAVSQTAVELSGETVLSAVFGILRVASGFKDFFKPKGTSVLGVGKNKMPENTLVLTNERLLILVVPMTGGDNIVGQIDYSMQNIIFNRGELKRRGEETLQRQSMPEILGITAFDIRYADIMRLTLRKGKIVIEKNSGEKIAYAFMDQEYVPVMRGVFEECLKEKFTYIQ